MSNEPNLFKYATSELSQDAVICWLADCARTSDHPLFPLGMAFIQQLYELDNSKAQFFTGETWKTGSRPVKIDAIKKIVPQRNKVDVYIEAEASCNDKVITVHFVIEDKKNSSSGKGQLVKYRDAMQAEAGEHDIVKLIYFKSGHIFQDEKAHVQDMKYSMFSLEGLNDFFDEHGSTQDKILAEFVAHVGHEKKRYQAERDKQHAAMSLFLNSTDEENISMDWLAYDHSQYEFMLALAKALEGQRGWLSSTARPNFDPWKNDAHSCQTEKGNFVYRNKNVGGSPYVRFYFLDLFFWSLDQTKFQLCLRMHEPTEEALNNIEDLQEFFGDCYEMRFQKRASGCGWAKIYPAVGKIKLGKGGIFGQKLLAEIPRLHDDFLKKSMKWRRNFLP